MAERCKEIDNVRVKRGREIDKGRERERERERKIRM